MTSRFLLFCFLALATSQQSKAFTNRISLMERDFPSNLWWFPYSDNGQVSEIPLKPVAEVDEDLAQALMAPEKKNMPEDAEDFDMFRLKKMSSDNFRLKKKNFDNFRLKRGGIDLTGQDELLPEKRNTFEIPNYLRGHLELKRGFDGFRLKRDNLVEGFRLKRSASSKKDNIKTRATPSNFRLGK